MEVSCTGSIALEVIFGSPGNYHIEELIFEIAPFSSDYKELLGRTMFARFNAVPHYAYRKLKMPGPRGVIMVHGKVEPSFGTNKYTTALAAETTSNNLQPNLESTSRLPGTSRDSELFRGRIARLIQSSIKHSGEGQDRTNSAAQLPSGT